jgi:hypothetical protein
LSIGRVVRHFEGLGKVPVDIKDVLELVRAIEPDEKIRIRSVNVDPEKLRGNCYRYRVADSGILVPLRKTLIVYSGRQDPYWQRLVCCKELVHIMDPDPLCTTTLEQVVHLAERLKKPAPATAPINANEVAAFFDLLARWHAMAILFPFGLWEELLPKYKAKKVDLATISKWLELPPDYVGVVLTDQWKTIREGVLAFV